MHRIGRTGRAGAQGEALSLVCVDEEGFLRDIQKLIKREIPREVVPGFEPDPNAKPEPIVMGRMVLNGGLGKSSGSPRPAGGGGGRRGGGGGGGGRSQGQGRPQDGGQGQPRSSQGAPGGQRAGGPAQGQRQGGQAQGQGQRQAQGQGGQRQGQGQGQGSRHGSQGNRPAGSALTRPKSTS